MLLFSFHDLIVIPKLRPDRPNVTITSALRQSLHVQAHVASYNRIEPTHYRDNARVHGPPLVRGELYVWKKD